MGYTVLRQLLGALAAWLVQWGAERGMALDEGTLLALMLATFGLVAQGLKHFTSKAGEVQPGGVAADTTAAEKAKVASAKAAR